MGRAPSAHVHDHAPESPFPSEEKKTDLDYWIGLETAPCNFGGKRWWFRCPLANGQRPCERRCFKLYLPPGADYYGCQACYELTYESAQEAHTRDGLYRWIAEQNGLPIETVKKYFA